MNLQLDLQSNFYTACSSADLHRQQKQDWLCCLQSEVSSPTQTRYTNQ